MQRRGRAGRVRAGTCYCCYKRQLFEERLRQYAVPEVARVPLEELVLQVGCL
jgi:ATP-dependent RNA helicase DHX29